MLAVIVALNLSGWGILVFIVAPGHFSVGGHAFGVGIGLTAYAPGSRHAFDVDHIAAIDNVTRKLMNDGQRPLAVGFFFALGHAPTEPGGRPIGHSCSHTSVPPPPVR